VKDAVFASPLFPRFLNGDLIRDTIARGVSNGALGYVGKTGTGDDPFLFGGSMSPQEVEISDDVFVITAETAEAHRQSLKKTPQPVHPGPLFGGDAGPSAGTAGAQGVAVAPGAEDVKPEPPAVTDRCVFRGHGDRDSGMMAIAIPG